MVFLLIQGRICFFFRVALRTLVKCSSIRLLKRTGMAHTLHGRRNSQVKERLAFSIAFVVVVLFEGVLKTKQEIPKYYSKIAPRNKGLSLNLSVLFSTSWL